MLTVYQNLALAASTSESGRSEARHRARILLLSRLRPPLRRDHSIPAKLRTTKRSSTIASCPVSRVSLRAAALIYHKLLMTHLTAILKALSAPSVTTDCRSTLELGQWKALRSIMVTLELTLPWVELNWKRRRQWGWVRMAKYTPATIALVSMAM